ncbi:M1 family metallopeptidase [Microvirga sp. STR05]|uniref:M1 family metallopeptidase n=1 Tax=Hymenobacter duratus TaxID=2771356 RepID=A0ABR8JEY3_9BACT|nr:M1 family metallopeptidase [Hymenobacter duratus]MBD2714121.1 M1 family metallopeptidase [Hymenobacter duratus]MBR7949023.1 M1 family metallopeptidase [Microvirga sp. STR05]
MPRVLLLLAFFLACQSHTATAQLLQPRPAFTRADSLRGSLTPLRTCYDINYYHLDVKLDVANRALSGSNLFRFTAAQDFTRLQFDLFANLKVDKVEYQGKSVPFTREANAVFVTFPQPIRQGAKDEFRVYYSGQPTVAKKAPWDGGLVFTQDAQGKPWVASACQGVGASIWWPTKDHQADEVDSMLISIAVPKGLKDVSNGRLRKTTKLKGGYTRFDWFVDNPINNYDVALNVGDYQHFSGSTYAGEKGPLTVDYWVMPENLTKAKAHFTANVPPMLKSMEHWFGPYPFYEDGYKLVDAPHLGMEHQSAVAYGNKYLNGYLGQDRSNTGWGSKWDFIIIHESGHEWFGNNITSKDIADMWVHEGFTCYSEALFVESQYGKQAGQEYIHGQRRNIQNNGPIIGTYGVNQEGSGDMYDKGSNLLNMVRTALNDDEKWRQILRGLGSTFYHQTVTTEQVVGYINQQSGRDFTPIFDQYLRHPGLPTLEIRFEQDKVLARWIADVPAFDLPVRVRTKGGEYVALPLTTKMQPLAVPGLTKDNLEVDTFNYYIGVLVE